jgi:para-nitrobenzyl esterase
LLKGFFALFIKPGNPTGAGVPAWPATTESAGGLLRQTIDAHPRSVVDNGAARQAFLQQFYARQPGAL